MHEQQPWISYSRNRNHYTMRGTRYDERSELYTYSFIPPAVGAMAAAGFLENTVAPNNPTLREAVRASAPRRRWLRHWATRRPRWRNPSRVR